MNSWIQLKNGSLFNLNSGVKIYTTSTPVEIKFLGFKYLIQRNSDIIFQTDSEEEMYTRFKQIKIQLGVKSYQTFDEIKQEEEHNRNLHNRLHERYNK